MRLRSIGAVPAVIATMLLIPAGAQARTPCPSEDAAPTAANAAQVSDAIFCLTNQVRANFGLPAFHRDSRLDAAASGHSADMASRGYFSHATPEGQEPDDRARAQGYTIGTGENIAAGYGSARAVVSAWMASAGHCYNILSSARDLGVGTAVGSSPDYTQDFGDYFSATVAEAPSDACPYAGLDLDTLQVLAAAPDTASPAAAPSATVSALSLSPRRFRAGRGTTVSYTLSDDATVSFRVEQELAGRSVGGRCRAPARSNRGAPRCLRQHALGGSITQDGVAGTNALRFTGRIGSGPKLKPGRYELQVLAGGSNHSSSVKRSLFQIVRS